MNDQQMNLRLYTPAGFRIEIPNAWEGSWNAFYNEHGDTLWELYELQDWDHAPNTFYPYRIRDRGEYISIRTHQIRCPKCSCNVLAHFQTSEKNGKPRLKYDPYCSKECTR